MSGTRSRRCALRIAGGQRREQTKKWKFLSRPLGTTSRVFSTVLIGVLVAYVATWNDDVFDLVNRLAGRDPVTAHVFADDVTGTTTGAFAGSKTIATDVVAATTTGVSFTSLAGDHGLIPVGNAAISVTLEGNQHDSVLLEKIEARVVSRSAAPAAVLLAPPSTGGSPVTRQILGFDLDSPSPQARVPREKVELGEEFTRRVAVEIKRNEKYPFTFQATTHGKELYRWVVDLTLLVDGKRQKVVLGERSPFAVTGLASRYEQYVGRDGEKLTVADQTAVCGSGDCRGLAPLWARLL